MAVRSTGSKRPRYVLIVEDNVHHAEILTEVLDKHFAPVVIHTVDTIEDGLDFASQSTYDLILTGAIVRDEQITDAIPKFTKLADGAPIIVISGRGDEMLAAEIIKRGATEYLVKTRETLETLHTKLAKHLKSRKKGRKIKQAKGGGQPKHHLPSPATIVREVDKLTQQALAIVGPKRRRGRRSTDGEQLDQLLTQIQRLRQMAAKLIPKE